MKKLALTLLILFNISSAWAARTVYLTGRDSASGYCSSNSSFCYSGIKDRAISGAKRDVQWNCQMQRGQSLTYTLSCYSNCSPAIMPPNVPNVFVSCNADCRMSCEIKE